jgi:hypothetical protein
MLVKSAMFTVQACYCSINRYCMQQNGSSRVYAFLSVVDVDWQASFWKDPTAAIREAYLNTDITILDNAPNLGPGGSTAVTAILIDGKNLLVANVGDSRAVISKGGVAEQLSIDHEPGHPTERDKIENRGGFVSNMPGSITL